MNKLYVRARYRLRNTEYNGSEGQFRPVGGFLELPMESDIFDDGLIWNVHKAAAYCRNFIKGSALTNYWKFDYGTYIAEFLFIHPVHPGEMLGLHIESFHHDEGDFDFTSSHVTTDGQVVRH